MLLYSKSSDISVYYFKSLPMPAIYRLPGDILAFNFESMTVNLLTFYSILLANLNIEWLLFLTIY